MTKDKKNEEHAVIIVNGEVAKKKLKKQKLPTDKQWLWQAMAEKKQQQDEEEKDG